MTWENILKEDKPKTFRGTEEQRLTITDAQHKMLVDRIMEAVMEEIGELSKTRQLTKREVKDIRLKIMNRVTSEFNESRNE